MRLEIRQVGVDDEVAVADVCQLFLEYAHFLGVDLGFQGVEQEFAELPGTYALPMVGQSWPSPMAVRPNTWLCGSRKKASAR